MKIKYFVAYSIRGVIGTFHDFVEVDRPVTDWTSLNSLIIPFQRRLLNDGWDDKTVAFEKIGVINFIRVREGA